MSLRKAMLDVVQVLTNHIFSGLTWSSAAIATSKNRRNQRRGKPNANGPQYVALESRQLLAAIIFDSATGNLTLAGDADADVGTVNEISGDRLQANLSGVASQNFRRADVTQITFIGFAGNDRFTNNTSKPSFQYGGDGNDILTGGSAADVINGGRGNDQISGRGAADRLVGNLGNDIVNGDDGSDSIFGTAGNNTLNGGNGQDIIYGGDEADTINGGTGMDQIFGLAGDDIIDSGDGGVIGSSGIGQSDLVLGLDGNDRITGGLGLNVFYGGNGNDVLIGGSNAENRLHGQNGNDSLTGGGLGDYIAGGLGVDNIDARGGSDYVVSSQGDDRVEGGAGRDFMIFTGLENQYRINGTTSLSVRDRRDIPQNEGTDTATGFERFRFANTTTDAVSPIREFITVRPIFARNSNGSSAATFFGNEQQEVEIKNLIDDIFYQALVDVRWENERGWNDTFANRGNGGNRPQSDLSTIVTRGDAAGVGSSNPLVLDAYFVEIVPGFGQLDDNFANGLAFVSANGSAMHVGDNLVTFENGREVVARVVAHELAHNLGLTHVNASGNLMGEGSNLNSSQINTIIASRFTRPV
ncbi:MAG: hypothetical protein AAFN77_10335 [Planctomycetota bacterium]